MTWKQRIYDLLLPLPEAAAPAASTFSEAARLHRDEQSRADYELRMEIERRRGMVGS